MSPWKVLGWLLVALLCLLLTAGAYGLALLWGWSLPSVWWLAAIAGAGAGVALIIFLFRTMRDDTHEPAAPLPVELPSERLPRWLLLDGGELFPHLPGILESAGRCYRYRGRPALSALRPSCLPQLWGYRPLPCPWADSLPSYCGSPLFLP